MALLRVQNQLALAHWSSKSCLMAYVHTARNIHTRLRTHAESIAFFGGGPREGRTVAAYFDRLTKHLKHVANIRWLHSVADDFFTKQLPFNVTWVLTLMYALDQGQVATDPVAQASYLHCPIAKVCPGKCCFSLLLCYDSLNSLPSCLLVLLCDCFLQLPQQLSQLLLLLFDCLRQAFRSMYCRA